MKFTKYNIKRYIIVISILLFTLSMISVSFADNNTTTNQPNTSSLSDADKIRQGSMTYSPYQIKTAAIRTQNYLIKYKKLPNTVRIGNTKMDMNDFLYIMCKYVNNTNNSNQSYIAYKTINTAYKSKGTYCNCYLNKRTYLQLTNKLIIYMNKYKRPPKYMTVNKIKIRFQDLIFMYSWTVKYYKNYGKLPEKTRIQSYYTRKTTKIIGRSLQPISSLYTTSLSKLYYRITKGKKTKYAKAVAIYNWVRDYICYSSYYNTKKGAAKTLKATEGNCCDQAHLLKSLYAKAGITTRYHHVTATFTSGKRIGHVYLLVYINNKRYRADTTSIWNSFGVIKNWKIKTAKSRRIYKKLPF